MPSAPRLAPRGAHPCGRYPGPSFCLVSAIGPRIREAIHQLRVIACATPASSRAEIGAGLPAPDEAQENDCQDHADRDGEGQCPFVKQEDERHRDGEDDGSVKPQSQEPAGTAAIGMQFLPGPLRSHHLQRLPSRARAARQDVTGRTERAQRIRARGPPGGTPAAWPGDAGLSGRQPG